MGASCALRATNYRCAARRLWFVRIPRPPEVGAVKPLDQELETYKIKYKLLSEAFNVKKVRSWRAAAGDQQGGGGGPCIRTGQACVQRPNPHSTTRQRSTHAWLACRWSVTRPGRTPGWHARPSRRAARPMRPSAPSCSR